MIKEEEGAPGQTHGETHASFKGSEAFCSLNGSRARSPYELGEWGHCRFDLSSEMITTRFTVIARVGRKMDWGGGMSRRLLLVIGSGGCRVGRGPESASGNCRRASSWIITLHCIGKSRLIHGPQSSVLGVEFEVCMNQMGKRSGVNCIGIWRQLMR